jgi:hypothetical protein
MVIATDTGMVAAMQRARKITEGSRWGSEANTTVFVNQTRPQTAAVRRNMAPRDHW